MTLGPALLVLAYLDRRSLRASHPLVVVGRVPLFYYVSHFWLLHLLASAVRLGAIRQRVLRVPFQSATVDGRSRGDRFRQDFGYPLWVTYAVWIPSRPALSVVRWFAGFKARRRDWWLSYV